MSACLRSHRRRVAAACLRTLSVVGVELVSCVSPSQTRAKLTSCLICQNPVKQNKHKMNRVNVSGGVLPPKLGLALPRSSLTRSGPALSVMLCLDPVSNREQLVYQMIITQFKGQLCKSGGPSARAAAFEVALPSSSDSVYFCIIFALRGLRDINALRASRPTFLSGTDKHLSYS